MPTVADWHARFQHQSRWTAQVQRFLFDGLGLSQAQNGLEVGCGTGVIARELAKMGPARLHGIDLRLDFLELAYREDSALRYACANGLKLPFASASFAFTFCHYFLLWISDPLAMLTEMRRVTRPGGPVFAIAEPDYGGRIDYPASLAGLAQKQALALRNQGANPELGRGLLELFHQAGFHQPRSAVMGGQWGQSQSPQDLASEWNTLASDLSGQVPPLELEEYKKQDALAWNNGQRILYIPTFYAWGFV